MKNDATPLSDDLLDSLERQGEVHSFAAGEVLVREGESSNQLYILLSGELKVFTNKASGRELVYNTLRPGEYFGELSLDGNPRSASVRAVTDSRCVVVTGDVVGALVRTHPDFVDHLVSKLIHLLRRATLKLKSVALDDVCERIIALIDEEAVLEGDVRHLPRTFTQQEIANRIGASREMVNHVLRDLARDGFIIRDRTRGLVVRKPLPRRW